MSYGEKSRVAISFQDSFGTSNVNSLHHLALLSESVGLSIESLVERNMRGVHDEGAHYEGPHSVAGDLEAEAHPISLGAMLKAVLGEPTTITSDGLYGHTFEPRTSDWDGKAANVPATILKYLDDGGSAQVFYDLVGSTLELSMAHGEFLKAKVGFVGGRQSQVAAVAASYPTGKLWTWDVVSASVATSAWPELTQLTVKLDESLEAQGTLDASKTPSRVKRTGFRVVTVDGSMKFDNQNEFQQFLAQSERELIVHAKGSVEVQSGYYDELTVKVPLMRYVEFNPAAGGPGQIEVGFSAKGVYSTTSATALNITLQNTQAGY
ncbi:MAG: phage tail tube protein [bacterium]